MASHHAKSCDSFPNFQFKFIHGQLTPIGSRASLSLKVQDAKTEAGAWQYGSAGSITREIKTPLSHPGGSPQPRAVGPCSSEVQPLDDISSSKEDIRS